MKCKYDFITNSSSASFILYIESTINDIDDFKKEFNNHVMYESGRFGAGANYHVLENRNFNSDGDFKFPKISQLSNNTFKVEAITCMFNGFEDLPSYIIDLLIKNSMVEKELPPFIKSVKFEVGDF